MNPFDFGIRDFKSYLRRNGVPKHKTNQAVRLYKNRLYDRVAKVKSEMEAELLGISERKDNNAKD